MENKKWHISYNFKDGYEVLTVNKLKMIYDSYDEHTFLKFKTVQNIKILHMDINEDYLVFNHTINLDQKIWITTSYYAITSYNRSQLKNTFFVSI